MIRQQGFRNINVLIHPVLVPPNTPWQIKAGKPVQSVGPTNKPNCQPSKTTINNGMTTCRQQLIFEEDFKSQGIDPGKWVIERRIPSDQQVRSIGHYRNYVLNIAFHRPRARFQCWFGNI